MTVVTNPTEKEDTTPAAPKPDTFLKYPSDLGKEGSSKTYIRFHIKDRLDLQNSIKSIYLYAPPGLSVADGVGYHQLDMGSIGGLVENFEDQRAGGKGFIDSLMGSANTADLKALGSLSMENIGKGFGQRMLMKAGIARNPFSVQQFSGVVARSFNFTFKLVAESHDQGKVLKLIENTFRKYLYPSIGESNMQLKYPPYWQIEFYRGAEKNTHLPFINLSFLQSMTATYNSSTNAFHKDGRPLEVDISLTFTESKNMTREDLYDGEEYSYDYTPGVAATDVDAVIDAGTTVTTDALGK